MSSDLGALWLVYTLAPTGAHSCTQHHHLERSEGSKLSLGKKKSKGSAQTQLPEHSHLPQWFQPQEHHRRWSLGVCPLEEMELLGSHGAVCRSEVRGNGAFGAVRVK